MEPTILTSPLLPSRQLRCLVSASRILLGLVAAAWLLFGLSWFAFYGWIVPRIGDFRPRLETEASKALGVQVRIESMTAYSQGMIPSFELKNVILLDAAGRQAVRLPRVLGTLSISSLSGLGFEQLLIDQPELDIRRASDGKIYVGGLDISQGAGTSHNAAADWFFAQTELVLLKGVVRWTDELHQAPPLALTQVDFVLRNARRRHLMRLDATPPAEWGDRFSVRGIFRQPLLTGAPGDFSSWTGQVYADSSRADLSRIKYHVGFNTLGMQLISGHGALRAWADVSKGRLTGGTADVALHDVDAKFGSKLQPLAFESVVGRVSGGQRANGFDFSTEGLRFNTPDGLRWPGGNVVLAHTNAHAGLPQRSELKADKLDLEALAQIADRLPIGSNAHALVASFAPKGLIDVIEAHWQGPMEAPTDFAAKGRVTNFKVASSAVPGEIRAGVMRQLPGRPGISSAAIDFDMSHEGGKASIKIANGALDLPGVFEDPRVPLDQLSVDAQWKLSGEKVEAHLRNLQFSNADTQGQAQVTWRTEDVLAGFGAGLGSPAAVSKLPNHRSSGIVDLEGSLSRGDGTRVHRYLPLVLPDQVRHYVRDAVVQGRVSDVKFKVKGRVDHIPFPSQGKEEFRVSARVHNGQFAYVPKSLQPSGAAPWPALTELNGQLVFNRASLEVNGAVGRLEGLAGLQIVKANARIADLTRNATVDVTVDVKGALDDALRFVNTSPLSAMTGHALATASASGTADYGFHLSLPVHAIDKSKVEGTISLPGNEVQFSSLTPQFTRLKGVVKLNEKGFLVTGAQAILLGGEVRFEGGTRSGERPPAGVSDSEASVAFKGQGTITAEGLRQSQEMGLVSRLAQNASGSAAYNLSLGFRRGVAEVAVTSTLEGMALDLPAPLKKTAQTALPLRFENSLLQASLGLDQKLQDQLSLTLGRLASIRYVRDVSGAEPRVLRGSIDVGLEPDKTAPLPGSGVAAHLNLAELDFDAWEKIFTASQTDSGVTTAPLSASTLAAKRAVASTELLYLPTTLTLRAKELTVQGHKLNQVVIDGARDELTWRANIAASELKGQVEFQQPRGGGAGRVVARLSRLNLTPGTSTASNVDTILSGQPTSIPALDIMVEDLELNGKKLGRVEIDAVNQTASGPSRDGGREWRVNKFKVILPEAVLTATGSWAPAKTPAELRRTSMNFKLDIADSGELLNRFGMADLIRRGKGKLEGQVAWAGSPLSLHYPTLNGQFNVNVESGQFVKADPGIAKLLGVLSLQSLPRRLTLDFRDVFSEGFAFDFVRGDVTIKQGLALTNNLQMRGVNAAVLMEGSADIALETQTLKVVVVPEIDAGTASLIATVINPAVGLGTFLAQIFLRRPLMEAATQEFQVNGTWADPKVTKVDRKAAAGENNDTNFWGTR